MTAKLPDFGDEFTDDNGVKAKVFFTYEEAEQTIVRFYSTDSRFKQDYPLSDFLKRFTPFPECDEDHS